jgi:hypothetical protein
LVDARRAQREFHDRKRRQMSDLIMNERDANALRCRNCDFDLSTVAHAKFCPECGQETSLAPPTLREFVNHFFGNYIAVKGGFVQTLWRLITRPGALTVDYLQGRKRRYMLPFRLYLTISVISFLVFGLLASQGMRNTVVNDGDVKAAASVAGAVPDAVGKDIARDVEKLKGVDLRDVKKGRIFSFGDNSYIEFDAGNVTCHNVPNWACSRAKTKFGSTEAFRNLIETLPERIIRYWAYAMFALVPIYAALIKLVYVRRRMTYGSHVVFALHLHAFWLLAILFSFAHEWATAIATFAVPIYAVLALRRVYGGGWIKTLLKASMVSLLYFFVAAIGVGVVAIVALLV